jgi:hypothetical protein
MLLRALVAASLLAIVPSTWATPPKNAVLVDHSTPTLMDPATALGMLDQAIGARIWKLYPASRWGYVTEVAGGINAGGTCVVTARVMMMQLTPTLKAMLYRPKKTSTSFDALPNATQEQCRDLAKTKLHEAIDSVMSGLAES